MTFNFNQKNLLIVIFTFVVLLGFFFFYFQTKLAKIEKRQTSFQPQGVSQQQQEEKAQPSTFIPTRIKTYTITISQNMLSPAGMSVEPEDKIEFKLKNETEETVTFQANQDLQIDQDIILQPDEEQSITFTAPKDSGEYKFIIKTSQGNLEGLLIVR